MAWDSFVNSLNQFPWETTYVAALNWYVDIATSTIVEDGVHSKLGHFRVQPRLFRALSSDINCRSSLVDKSATSYMICHVIL